MNNLSRNARAREAIFIERPRSLSAGNSLVCLNFKVPLRVRQQFKICAARHNMTMTDLLLRLVDDCLTSDDNHGEAGALTMREIKK
jgi:hypothetical protein